MRPKTSDYEAVRELGLAIVNCVKTGNGQKLKELFYEHGVVFGYADGAFADGSLAAFVDAIDGHPAGDSLSASVDVISMDDTVAVARIVENGPFFFTHLATMLRVKGVWRVCSYVYNQDA